MPDEAREPEAAPRRKTLLLAALLALGSVVLYAPGWRQGFVWDDEYLITSHRAVAVSGSAWQALEPAYYRDIFYRNRAFYRPLTTLTFAAEHALWGKNPAGCHITNTVLYAASVALLFLLLLRVTGRRDLAFLAAFLFLLHASHAETVLWIKCRAEMLAFLAFVLGLLAFLRSLRSPARGANVFFVVLSLVLFILGLGAKMTVITLPAVAALTVLWIGPGPNLRRAVMRTWPLWAVAGLYVILGRTVLNRPPGPETAATGAAATFPFAWRVLATLGFYVRLAFWPGKLSIIHEIPEPGRLGALIAWPIVVAVLAAGTWLVFRLRSSPRWRWAACGVAWFAVTLLPVLNLVPIPGRPVAEQRLFLPSAGFCLAAGAALVFCWNWRPARAGASSPVPRTALPAALGTLLLAALFIAFQVAALFRVLPAWRTEETLWRDVLEDHPGLVFAQDRLGVLLTRRGEYEEAQARFRKALELDPGDVYAALHEGVAAGLAGDATSAAATLRNVVVRRPDMIEAWSALAEALLRLGQYREAADAAERALALNPRLRGALEAAVRAYAGLGMWDNAIRAAENLRGLEPTDPGRVVAVARLQWHAGRADEAVRTLERAMTRFPKSGELPAQIAEFAHENGSYGQAAQYWRSALALEERPEWRNGLGRSLLLGGKVTEAVDSLERAAVAAPGNPGYLADLAEAFLVQGNAAAAAERYREALQLDPTEATAWGGLGVSLTQLGQRGDGIEALERGVQLEPDNPLLQRNLGMGLLQAGEAARAVEALKHATSLAPDSGPAWQLLAAAYRMSGATAEAEKAAARARELQKE